jgi:hypothetical protein
MSCEGPHSVIAEYTRGSAIGPQIYRDCAGCMRGPQALEARHAVAMSDLDMALMASMAQNDVQHQSMSVEEAQPGAASGLMSVPYCSGKTRRGRKRC